METTLAGYAIFRYYGLNRTMQYGNSNVEEYVFTGENMFKSYYVVWKPKHIPKIYTSKGRLNRTMQYGNIVVLYRPIKQ